MKNEPLEKDIQSAVCDYLARKKYFFWRSNTTPIFDKGRGAYRAMPKYSKSGVPDIILVLDGMFIGLEVKRRTTGQNEAQKAFEKGVREAGGEYHIVRSIDDLVEIGL